MREEVIDMGYYCEVIHYPKIRPEKVKEFEKILEISKRDREISPNHIHTQSQNCPLCQGLSDCFYRKIVNSITSRHIGDNDTAIEEITEYLNVITLDDDNPGLDYNCESMMKYYYDEEFVNFLTEFVVDGEIITFRGEDDVTYSYIFIDNDNHTDSDIITNSVLFEKYINRTDDRYKLLLSVEKELAWKYFDLGVKFVKEIRHVDI